MSSPLSLYGRRRAFIDTSAYFALTDSRSSDHGAARLIAERLTAEHWPTFTSNFILAETYALLLSRLGRGTAVHVVSAIKQSAATTVVRVTPADEAQAWSILLQYADKSFSLTDAMSFAIMRRLSIPYAFSFDSDFVQYGLTVLTP